MNAAPPSLHPAHLPPGTQVGPWRVVAWAGQGIHGAVYRAVPLRSGHSAPVALKLALRPGDPRLAREALLLSRLRHPSVPRLWDSGSWGEPSARYVHLPADDLYALGMTACRLLTGEYPQWVDPAQDEHGIWQVHTVRTPASLRGVEPSVRAWILRLLSVRPEQRGTAAQFAQALERASHPPPEPTRLPAPAHAAGPWLALAAGLTLLVWAESPEPSVHAPLAEDTLPEPLPGQLRSDAKGRCPRKCQVALNGVCWVPSSMDREECEALGSTGKLFKGLSFCLHLAVGSIPAASTVLVRLYVSVRRTPWGPGITQGCSQGEQLSVDA